MTIKAAVITCTTVQNLRVPPQTSAIANLIVLQNKSEACFEITAGFSIESAPNVEYGKMRSELNECALGVDLRGIHSAFYFIRAKPGMPTARRRV